MKPGEAICNACGQKTLYGRHLNNRPCTPPVEDRPNDSGTVTFYPPSSCLPCGGMGARNGYVCAACRGTGTTVKP